MKVSGAVAMADHVEAFGLSEYGGRVGGVMEDALNRLRTDKSVFIMHENGTVEPVRFDTQEDKPQFNPEPSVAEIARIRGIIQDAANSSEYRGEEWCSCGMAWDAAKAVLKAIRAP